MCLLTFVARCGCFMDCCYGLCLLCFCGLVAFVGFDWFGLVGVLVCGFMVVYLFFDCGFWFCLDYWFGVLVACGCWFT